MSTGTQTNNIDSILTENRVFECSEEFRSKAHIRGMDEYERLYQAAETDPETFWSGIASQLHWFKPWDKVLDWDCALVEVVLGGGINLSYNCLDRHVAGSRRNKAAIIWEGEPGEVRDPYLPATAARGLEVRQRSEVAGRAEGRPRRHLHGHVPCPSDRDAGVRAHRRPAHRDLRGLLGQRTGRPYYGLAGRSR